MAERTSLASIGSTARIAGLLYLLNFLTALPIGLAGKLFVRGDAAATVANIVAQAPLFWVGFTFELVNVASYVAVTALFYVLFKPVNKIVALAAVFFSLIGCAAQAVGSAFYAAPQLMLGGVPYLSTFKLDQLQSLAYLSLRMYTQAYDVGLAFFGFFCVLIGFLIFKSTFLPRVLGVLMALAGLGWLTFLAPPLANSLMPYNIAPGLIGEGALTLWLVFAGVNVQRWKDQAAGTAG